MIKVAVIEILVKKIAMTEEETVVGKNEVVEEVIEEVIEMDKEVEVIEK